MANIRSQNELILSALDFYRVAQPSLSTAPGSSARDVLVDGPSKQIAQLYQELGRVSSIQSLRLAIGQSLDLLASNVGAVRKPGSKSQGPALFTFNSIEADFAITTSDTVTAKNGSTFQILANTVVSSVLASTYKSIATKYRADLDFLGITDQYAVELLSTATATGEAGNISKYSLTKTSVIGINNVTNVSAFGGGSFSESDASFKARILGIFAGANTGTSTGYSTAAKADTSVIDAIVIGPGDSLMTRDGTQVSIAADGTRTIISEGSGGKVDVIVYGTRLQSALDSFIYHNLSNTNDPTNIKNDFVLGQIVADAGKTVTQKRLDDLQTEVLPNQPINNLISASGSRSGPNFALMTVDNLGRVSGNYTLTRDTGAFAGSPWGFDRLHWISNKISDFFEDKTKGIFNGQDPLTFSDVLEIGAVVQNVVVTNENPKVQNTNRSSLQLAHFPITSVTRIFNVTTGEKYVVASQNPDGSGSINLTGRILISGKSLPAQTDILQADYTWIFSYDPYWDFDNRVGTHNPRTVQDSVDWGFSNIVRREVATLTGSGLLQATVTHPINGVISVNTFISENQTIQLSNGRLFVQVNTQVDNVISIIRVSDGAELWITTKSDGAISFKNIYLPTDSPGMINQTVQITYNAIDVFANGSFNGNIISVVAGSGVSAGTLVECTYLADISTLLPSTLLSGLPAIRSNNGFQISGGSIIGTQPTTHLFNSGKVVQNLRQAPSNLGLTIAGNISPGVITTSGTSITAILDIVFTVPITNLKQDLTAAIKTFYEINSLTNISSNIRIAKIARVEKVDANSNNDVLSVLNTYDIEGYQLFDNTFVKSESVQNNLLKLTEFVLPSTPNNLSDVPEIGDKLRVRFYIMTLGDTESIYFSKAGTLYTNKRFGIIDTLGISSGFTSGGSGSATLTISNLNQPATRSRYRAIYDYLAPKPNERITINYNFQKIISDVTLAIEDSRPITADVLVKSASPILVDATLNIIVTNEFVNDQETVVQNVQDAVTSALTANALGTIVDSSDLVNAAYSVNGVDRVRVMFFNRTGNVGSVLSVIAQKNQYIVANNVLITPESR